MRDAAMPLVTLPTPVESRCLAVSFRLNCSNNSVIQGKICSTSLSHGFDLSLSSFREAVRCEPRPMQGRRPTGPLSTTRQRRETGRIKPSPASAGRRGFAGDAISFARTWTRLSPRPQLHTNHDASRRAERPIRPPACLVLLGRWYIHEPSILTPLDPVLLQYRRELIVETALPMMLLLLADILPHRRHRR